jgi:hypothetical protein
MGILELKYNGKNYTNPREINNLLSQNYFYWLIDAEVDNAIIEIQKNTIIWHDGIFMSGDWYYGIFKGGYFYGNWKNGIFEDGYFDGKWNSGINLNKK